MGTTNDNVIKCWTNGCAAESHNGNLATDGHELWSYGLKIATYKANQIIVFDYTAPAGHMRSVTTSCHVNKAKPYADVIMNPKAAKAANLTNY